MDAHVDLIALAKQNWEHKGWEESEAMAAATSISRAHQIVLGRINKALAPFGLNFSRYEALALLSLTRRGSLPMGKLGQRLQVHPASVTNTIDRLEADGYVERVSHASDGRTTLASITPAGRSLAEKARHALTEIRYGLGETPRPATAGIVDALSPLRRSAGDFD